MLSKLLRLCYLAGWAGLLFGLILQFGIQDRVPGLALLFYAMPKPCLLTLAVTLLVWPSAGIKSRCVAALVSIALVTTWLHSSWRAEAVPSLARDETKEVRILFWNLDRPTGLHQGMVDLVKEFQPHIAGFVEPGPCDDAALCSKYEILLPGYKTAWMPRGILWLSRVSSRYRERGKLEGSGAFARFEVNDLGPPFPVVVADVFQHLIRPRKGQLDEVLMYAQGRADAILMGDFNTPLESVFLKPFRGQFTEALEVTGAGFKETWPFGLPLLSLDQLWLGHDWEVVEARKEWRITSSDHAALLVTLRRKEK